MSRKKKSKKLFHSPISLNIPKDDGTIHIDCIAFSDANYNRIKVSDWSKISTFLTQNKEDTTWLNLYPLENKKTLEQLEEYYGINPFLMADAVDFSLRSKTWFTEKHLFCSFKMIKPEVEGTEHISFIIGDNYLISFQENEDDIFDHIRSRIENNFGLIRRKGIDYLFFLLCDALIDQYTLVADESESLLLKMEEDLNLNHNSILLSQIHEKKKELSTTHKDIRAATDVLNSVYDSESPLITGFVRKLLSSIIHNAKYCLDSYTRQLENTKSLSDLYFSQQNNKLNEMIKWLTIMSSLFIPLSFIAGFYGMNFTNMPELSHPYAYPIIVGIMLSVSGYIIFLFKRKKWM
ncbi:MAG: magnesium/cobalt transporter CorA [Bacteroidia bacterium]|nr:magnesium/cobalt transporter CorA [Bacteroidia bacterium]NNJ55082.1 magnesium/cobalt transporter CorA [Bacteroidia bacterium]